MNTKRYKIRPSGRHILTIGRDLIKDSCAAIVELVKNAYDADSPDVVIEFKTLEDKHLIVITDHGHGMSLDTVINNWMTLSTDAKVKNRTSPAGRTMQGRKGIGRFSASILGEDLLLESITPTGELTRLYIEWDKLENAKFLDEVDFLIETEKTSQPSGTKLTITNKKTQPVEWDLDEFDNLQFELRKLISPLNSLSNIDKVKFSIRLLVNNFITYSGELINFNNLISSFPIFNFFDYKISGKIDENGYGSLIYTIQKSGKSTSKKIPFNLNEPTGCGRLGIDIRVYDRDKQSLESLINRGLKNESGNYFTIGETKKLLDNNNGIRVYRNGFWIRPLGSPESDWLELNKKRIQNPSMRIGSDQAIGIVQVESEESSGLIEQSARDGLKTNTAFNRLKQITTKVISELESRRFDYRRQTGLSRKSLKIEQELERLFSFDILENEIVSELKRNRIDDKITNKVIKIITEEAVNKNKLLEDIREKIAIYQGQATLGKIINVILHEGRRPLNYLKNQIPVLQYWFDKYQKTDKYEYLTNCMPIIEGIGNSAEDFSILFSRLDPLATATRTTKKKYPLKTIIDKLILLFETNIKKNKISTRIIGDNNFKFLCWQQDIHALFANLIENSIYWISENRSQVREITIEITTSQDNLLYIDYQDTGSGIDSNLIHSGVIFEPHFSTKENGAGLGLAIAGEAAIRNGLELEAISSETGAHFRIKPNK